MRISINYLRGFRGKLLFLLAVPAIILGVVGQSALHRIRSQNKDIELLGRVYIPMVGDLGEMETYAQAIGRNLWAAYAHGHDLSKRRLFIQSTRDSIEHFENAVKRYGSFDLDPEIRAAFASIPNQWINMVQVTEGVISLLEKNSPETDERARTMILDQYTDPSVKLAQTLRSVDSVADKITDRKVASAEERSNGSTSYVLFVSIAGTLCFLILGLVTASRLVRLLSGATENISRFADLTEMASLNYSKTTHRLSDGSTEAANSLQDAVSSLDELSTMVQKNSKYAVEASALSKKSCESAQQGEKEIHHLIDAMAEVGQSAKKIEETIILIQDIAFQTNLLALNASVEAARAGEQGRGFAVVAESVRNLAQKSASAAHDITRLIKESVNRAERGKRIGDSSREVLKNIVDSIKKVSDLNNEIAFASSEQSEGITLISKFMSKLGEATQNNAGSAAEAVESSVSMSKQAHALHDQINELSVIIEGKKAS